MLVDHQNNVQATYVSGMNPGMQMRLEQQSIKALQSAMERFLPDYITADGVPLPKDKHYAYDFFGISALEWELDWNDIDYGAPTLDI